MKKTLIFILAAVILLSTLTSFVCAADKPVYVALGDSIAFGYGLSKPDTEGFTHLLSDSLGTQLYNYAVNGMTSGGLYSYLTGLSEGSNDYKNLQAASFVTVTIGSNDLLGRLNSIWSQAMQAAGGQLNEAAFAILEASLTADSADASFSAGIAEYGDKLPKICEWLKAVNPNAQIIMTRFYNPYYGVILGSFDFSSMCDSYITRMNDVLDEGAKIYGYTIADSYTPFNASDMTNVDMAGGNFDPHPNTSGHIAIFKAVEAVADKAAITASAEPETTIAETETEATAETEAQTEAQTEAAQPSSAGSGSVTGKIILAAVAIAAFAVTGVIMSKRNKKK